MYKRLRHITTVTLMLFSFCKSIAQNAMPDTVCIGMNRIYKVTGSSPLSTFTWTIDGVTQPVSVSEMNATWNTVGVFLVTVQEHSPDGCDGELRSGFVYVEPKAKADAGPDIVVCFGNPAQLNGKGGTRYAWSPSGYLSNSGIANPIASIPAAGIYNYVLSASNNSCPLPSNDTVLITVLPQPKVFAGHDTTMGPGQLLQLQATDISNAGFNNYTWSPTLGLNDWLTQNPILTTAENDITYWVNASTAEGCKAKDAITVKISRTAEIYVPSAFAPNGINKLLHAIPFGIRDFQYFAIYNRYGQLVFRTSNPAEGWDGKYKGIPQSPAGFVWMAQGIGYNGKIITKKGNVLLVR